MQTVHTGVQAVSKENGQHPQKQMLTGGKQDAPSTKDGHQKFPQSEEELAWEILSGVWVNAEGKLVDVRFD
jgi:hypothetical protein